MKTPLHRLTRLGLFGLACALAVSSLNAGTTLKYTGVPFSSAWGTLANANHVIAVAEFDSLPLSGFVNPTAMTASVVDANDNVLLHIESQGPSGTPRWNGAFEWDNGLLLDWAWVLTTTDDGTAFPYDYISSVRSTPEDQAIVGYSWTAPWVGYAEGFSRGSWHPATNVPDGGSAGLLLALALSFIGVLWRKGR